MVRTIIAAVAMGGEFISSHFYGKHKKTDAYDIFRRVQPWSNLEYFKGCFPEHVFHFSEGIPY